MIGFQSLEPLRIQAFLYELTDYNEERREKEGDENTGIPKRKVDDRS